MTEKLQSMLHERASVPDFDPVDVAAVTRAGDRRRRRRRTAGLAAVVAAVVVAATATTLVTTREPGSAPPADRAVDTVPPGTRALSWAVGSQVHEGDTVVDVGHEVVTYVRTSAGYVLTDPAGEVWSWRPGDGAAVSLGTVDVDAPRLVADPATPWVAWMDVTGGQRVLTYVDQAEGAGSASGYEPEAVTGYDVPAAVRDGWGVLALDDDVLYWRDQRGIVAVDLAIDSRTGPGGSLDATTPGSVQAARVIDPDPEAGPGDPLTVLSAAGGQIAFADRRAGSTVVTVGPRPQAARVSHRGFVDLALLSPDARYLSVDSERLEVSVVGRPEPLDVDLGEDRSADGFATGYEWLGDSSLAVIGESADDPDRAALLRCSVVPLEGSTCESVVPDLGSFLDVDFVLPTGLPLG